MQTGGNSLEVLTGKMDEGGAKNWCSQVGGAVEKAIMGLPQALPCMGQDEAFLPRTDLNSERRREKVKRARQ